MSEDLDIDPKNLEFNEFDNDITRISKVAARLKIPYRYVIIQKQNENDDDDTNVGQDVNYLNFQDLMIEKVPEKDLQGIWSEIRYTTVETLTNIEFFCLWLNAIFTIREKIFQSYRDTLSEIYQSSNLDELGEEIISLASEIHQEFLSQLVLILINDSSEKTEDMSEEVDLDQIAGEKISREIYTTISEGSKEITTLMNEIFEISFETYSGGKDFRNILTDIINKFMKVTERGPKVNINFNWERIEKFYQSWKTSFEKETSGNIKKVERIIVNQDEIRKIPETDTSYLEIEKSTSTYVYDSPINPLPDAFDEVEISLKVPFVQYNLYEDKEKDREIHLTGRQKYKIYRPEDMVDFNFSQIMINESLTRKKQSIYLKLWMLEDDPSPGLSQTSSSYEVVHIQYLSESKKVRIKFDTNNQLHVSKEKTIKRLKEIMPTLTPPKEYSESRIRGSYIIYDVIFNPMIFYFLLINNIYFSEYLATSERKRPQAAQDGFRLQYRSNLYSFTSRKFSPHSSVLINCSEKKIDPGQRFQVKKSGKDYQADREIPCLFVQVERASSVKTAESFINIFTRLITIYQRKWLSVDNFMKYFVTGLTNMVVTKKTTGLMIAQKQNEVPATINRETGELIYSHSGNSKLLAHFIPEAFNSRSGGVKDKRYAGLCEASQPILIQKDERELWKAHMVPDKTFTRKPREILEYPFPGTPQFGTTEEKRYLVCPTDAYPFMGFIRNTLLNRDKFPFLPCCQTKDHSVMDTKSYYKVTRLGKSMVEVAQEMDEAKNKGGKYVASSSTDHIQKPGNLAAISSILKSFLNRLYPRFDVFRLGQIQDENSFIHVMLSAFDDEGYVAASNDEEKKDYARRFRISIREKVRLEILKQEFYDSSLEEIRKRLESDDFFDPLLYVRALENIFQTNIYIFNLRQEDLRTNKSQNLILIPRHLHFHASPPRRYGRTVCVLRNKGSNADNLPYPQCELIVMRDSNRTYKVFDHRMDELIRPAFNFVNQDLTIQIEGKDLAIYRNLYSSYNFDIALGNLCSRQYIDEAGKVRMLELYPLYDKEKKQYENRKIYAGLIPSAPLNKPSFHPSTISEADLPPAEVCLEMFEEATSFYTQEGKVVGLWFKLNDIQYAFYCPCQTMEPEKLKELVPGIEENSNLTDYVIPFNYKTISPVERLRKLRKVSLHILQICRFIYFLFGQEPNVTHFVDSIIKYDEKGLGKIETDLELSFRRVLKSTSVPELWLELKETLPSIVEGNKLLIADKSIREALIYDLRRFRDDHLGIVIDDNDLRVLKNFYSSPEDYRKSVRWFYLDSFDELLDWQQRFITVYDQTRRNIQNLRDQVVLSILPEFFNYREPYVYQETDHNLMASDLGLTNNRLYIIQNINSGLQGIDEQDTVIALGDHTSLLRVINLAITWEKERKNLGFFAQPYISSSQTGSLGSQIESLPAYRMYIPDKNGRLQLFEENGENGVRLLRYSRDNSYMAAMLPLNFRD